MVRKARGVTTARIKGNELFKASKFSEACVAYEEGLEHDSYNSVLLCNRAACRSKLGQFEKAIDDCTVALNLRPSYSKARLRRADCNAKVTTLIYIYLINATQFDQRKKILVAILLYDQKHNFNFKFLVSTSFRNMFIDFRFLDT